MTAINNKRIIYLDVLRIVSVFSMIVLHMCGAYWDSVPVTGFEFQVFNFYDSIVRACVPIFVMISGALFLNPQKTITIKNLFLRNILRVVSSFVFWSFLYAIYTSLYSIMQSGKQEDFWKLFLNAFANGHYHMWFLFTIVGLYILTPLLRAFAADKKLLEYFIVLSFIFTFGLSFISLFPEVSAFVNPFVGKFGLNMVVGFASYFCIGFYLHYYTISKRITRIIHTLAIISLIFTIVMTSVTSIKNNSGVLIFYNNFLPNTCFVGMSVFLVFKQFIPKINFKDKFLKLIEKVSLLSFGIYLVHDFIIMLFHRHLGLTPILYNPIFSVPINASLVFIISFGIIYVLSKIPVVNKYIM